MRLSSLHAAGNCLWLGRRVGKPALRPIQLARCPRIIERFPNRPGNIWQCKRKADGHESAPGWNDRAASHSSGVACRPSGDGDPLTLIVFVGGKAVASDTTSSERPDVTAALGLAFGAEKNTLARVTASTEPVRLRAGGASAERQRRRRTILRCRLNVLLALRLRPYLSDFA
jgi:hypothetical protein